MTTTTKENRMDPLALYPIDLAHSLTFSPTGVMANLVKEGIPPHEYVEPEPVVTWGPACEPLIVWRGELVDARKLDIFRGLTRGRQAVGVIPGGGWAIDTHDSGGEHVPDFHSLDPVVAWIITASGAAVPVCAAPTDDGPLSCAVADETIPRDFTVKLLPPRGVQH